MNSSKLQHLLIGLALAVGLVIMGAFTLKPTNDQAADVTEPEVEMATLRVTSVDPAQSVTFDAVWKGSSLRSGGKITGHQTPFEMDVPADAFQGLFAQSGGDGQMRVRLVSKADKGSGSWWSVGRDAPMLTITVDGGNRSVLGF
jgi:hypothetical protein